MALGGGNECLLQASVRMAGRQGGAALGAGKVENQVAIARVCKHVVNELAMVLGRRRRSCSWASVVEEAARAQGSRSLLLLLLGHAGRVSALAPRVVEGAVGAVAHGALLAFRKTFRPNLTHAPA